MIQPAEPFMTCRNRSRSGWIGRYRLDDGSGGNGSPPRVPGGYGAARLRSNDVGGDMAVWLIFEYADTAELFVLTGDTPETATFTNVADLMVGEREAVEARHTDTQQVRRESEDAHKPRSDGNQGSPESQLA